MTWHVKNGWLPDATGWHINSIGAFTGHGKDYMMAVLSVNANTNDDEQYGINTIEDIARLVQHGSEQRQAHLARLRCGPEYRLGRAPGSCACRRAGRSGGPGLGLPCVSGVRFRRQTSRKTTQRIMQ